MMIQVVEHTFTKFKSEIPILAGIILVDCSFNGVLALTVHSWFKSGPNSLTEASPNMPQSRVLLILSTF